MHVQQEQDSFSVRKHTAGNRLLYLEMCVNRWQELLQGSAAHCITSLPQFSGFCVCGRHRPSPFTLNIKDELWSGDTLSCTWCCFLPFLLWKSTHAVLSIYSNLECCSFSSHFYETGFKTERWKIILFAVCLETVLTEFLTAVYFFFFQGGQDIFQGQEQMVSLAGDVFVVCLLCIIFFHR